MPVHDQVNSGHGFECDAGCVAVVGALIDRGFTTVASCENVPGWVYPRKDVIFCGRAYQELTVFCMDMSLILRDVPGWELSLDFGCNVARELRPRACLNFAHASESSILDAIKSARTSDEEKSQ